MRPPLLQAPESAFMIPFVQVCMGFCLLLALVYGEAGLTLFALFTLAVGAGGRLWSRASLRHVDCGIVVNRSRLFPGEKLEIGIRAVNSKWLPVLLKIDLLTGEGVAGSGGDAWFHAEAGLLWYQRFLFCRDFYPGRRGIYDLGPPMIQGGDFFGFFFRQQPLPAHTQIVVYPRLVELRPLPLPRTEFFGIPGARSPVADPVYIFGTRDYHGGRPARAIHWKASARHGRLQEKLCEPAEQQKALLLLDVDGFEREAAAEAFENTLEVIASLAIQLNRRGIPLAFATNGRVTADRPRVIPVSRRPHQAAAILETLAGTTAEGEASVTDILSRGSGLPRTAASVYFAHRGSRHLPAARMFLKARRVPSRFVLAADSESAGRACVDADDTLSIEELRLRGDRPK